MWFAYGSMWISTAVATSFGLYFTAQPACLLALLIPALISIKGSSSDDDPPENR